MLERRTIPYTLYPLLIKSSVKYDPSCPVIPVINALFRFIPSKEYLFLNRKVTKNILILFNYSMY